MTPSHRPREGRSPVQGPLNSPSRPLGPDGWPLSPKVSVVSVQSSPSPSSRTARRRQKKARKKRKAQKKDLYLIRLFRSSVGSDRRRKKRNQSSSKMIPTSRTLRSLDTQHIEWSGNLVQYTVDGVLVAPICPVCGHYFYEYGYLYEYEYPRCFVYYPARILIKIFYIHWDNTSCCRGVHSH